MYICSSIYSLICPSFYPSALSHVYGYSCLNIYFPRHKSCIHPRRCRYKSISKISDKKCVYSTCIARLFIPISLEPFFSFHLLYREFRELTNVENQPLSTYFFQLSAYWSGWMFRRTSFTSFLFLKRTPQSLLFRVLCRIVSTL